jgi:hypothetical protein
LAKDITGALGSGTAHVPSVWIVWASLVPSQAKPGATSPKMTKKIIYIYICIFSNDPTAIEQQQQSGY